MHCQTGFMVFKKDDYAEYWVEEYFCRSLVGGKIWSNKSDGVYQ